MKNKLGVALLVSLLFFFSQTTPSRAQEDDTGEAASLNLQAYVPARILISYTYTNNFSVTDVSSMGKSLYKITSGPTSIEFKAEDIDRYTFTVDIKYAAVVTQSVQIAVFSAGSPPEGLQFNIRGSYVRLKFSLTVTEEPMYPSAQEVAEQVVLQVSYQLTEFERQTQDIMEMQNRNLTTMWVLIVFSLVVNLALLAAIILWIRPRQGKGR